MIVSTETVVLGLGGALGPSPFSTDLSTSTVGAWGCHSPSMEKNYLGLSEADGFKLTYKAPPVAKERLHDLGGIQYAEAKDLVSKSGGRIHDWKLKDNIANARTRNWPQIKPSEVKDGHVAICGSGPSIGRFDQLRELRKLAKKGVKVHAINRCHDFLISKGIYPWSASLLDPIPQVASYITPRRGIRYEIGSQCDPKTFDVFDKPDIQHYVWHARTTTRLDKECFNELEQLLAVPSRTSTNGLRSILLKYLQGFRHFHLFGFDSSYETYRDDKGDLQIVLGDDGKGKLHAHAKPEAMHDIRPIKIVDKNPAGETVHEADYLTNSAMLCQANEFTDLHSDIAHGIRDGFMDPISIYVHGDGLIPDIASSKRYRLHFNPKRNRNA